MDGFLSLEGMANAAAAMPAARRRSALVAPAGHGRAKYITGTCLGTSADHGWQGLLAERWHHSAGDLAEIKPRDTEVIVMQRGRTRVRRRGDGRLQEHDAGPGTVWLCPGGVSEDMIHLYGEIRESVHLYLPEPALARVVLAELGLDPDRASLRYEGGFHDPLLECIAQAVATEMASRSSVGGLLVESLSAALGVHLLRRYSTLEPAAAALPSIKGALDQRRLARVLAFVDARLDQPLRLEDIAREACLSPFHLARAFKAATGYSLHSHVARRRLEQAKAMLLQGDRSLAETALACGFSSQAHLSASFKRVMGVTPGVFRRAASSG